MHHPFRWSPRIDIKARLRWHSSAIPAVFLHKGNLTKALFGWACAVPSLGVELGSSARRVHILRHDASINGTSNYGT